MNRHTSTHRPSSQRRKKSGFTVLPLLLAALSLSLWPRARRNAPDKTDEQPKEPSDSDQTASVQQSETESSSSNENTEQEDASTSPPMPMNHLEGVLVWVQKRIWPLGASTLALSALSLFLYSQLFHMPITITSSSMVTALPMIFSLTIVFEVFLVLLILAPTISLFVPPSSDKKALIHQLREKPNPKILKRWFQSSLAILVILLLVLLGGPLIFPGHNILLAWVAIIGCTLTHIAFLLEQGLGTTHSKWHWKNLHCISSDYWMVLTCGAILQLLLSMNALQISLKIVSNWKYNDGWLLFFAAMMALVVILVIGVFQFMTVQIASHKALYEKFRSQKAAMILCMGLLFVFAAFLGAYFIDSIFRSTASGGRNCVQLTWVHGAASMLPANLVNPDNTAVSQPLQMLLEADGSYQVQLLNDPSQTIYFIPRTSIAALASCPVVTQAAK